MTKRFLSIVSLFFVALCAMAEGRAKYVFYFIGDGMGVNQVNAAETYLAAVEGRIGIKELCFPSFPYSAYVTTYSATNGVTDSSAGGVALASGHKTKNGAEGVLKDLVTPVTCIADWAHAAGAAVGVATSVSVDHATPAAFYAHVAHRSQTYEIGEQLTKSEFDFFAGSDFTSPKNPTEGGPDLYKQAQDNGFTIARGYKDYQKKARKSQKMILLQPEEASKRDRGCIPYAIDRTKEDLSLCDITRAGINYLMSKQGQKDGFFFMVEGGKIDWACHSNELTFISELIDMDDAVKVAYEFYQQHPDETLIVISADHETGGIVLSRGSYNLHLDVVAHQRMSIGRLGRELHALHEKYGERYNWDLVKDFLTENFGFWDKVKLNDDQTKRLENAFNKIMAGKGEDTKSLYQKDDELAQNVKHIINVCARITWATGSHSNGYVPCFAVGVGADGIHGRIDNTDIPKIMTRAAGWPITE
ncbi:MAG: alkaline phosphatase [Bacteroidaceae bacterium]|nr:alkaline phosphatase [Bacteroidaceae bacterium]